MLQYDHVWGKMTKISLRSIKVELKLSLKNVKFERRHTPILGRTHVCVYFKLHIGRVHGE